MAHQLGATHQANGYPDHAEFVAIPGEPDFAVVRLTSWLARSAESGGCEIVEQKAGFLRLKYMGRTIRVPIEVEDPPASDQFPTIPADDRLTIARCADCDGEGARFTEGEDGEVSYRLDFRRMDGAIGD